MTRSERRISLVAVVTALALLAMTPLPVWATFEIQITTTSGTVTVADNGVGDLNGGANLIQYSNIIDGIFINLDSAISNTPGGPTSSLLTLNWSLFPTGAATPSSSSFSIFASADGYTFPPNGTSSKITSDVASNLSGTGSVTAQQWVDLGNGLFVTSGPTPGIQGPFVGHGLFTSTKTVGFSSSGLYSITEGVDFLTLGVGSTAQGSIESTVVPEPITMFLGGTGLLAFAYAGRRRLFGR